MTLAAVVLRPGIFELIFVLSVLLACAGLGRAAAGARQRGEPMGPAIGRAARSGAPTARSLALSLSAAYVGMGLFGLVGVLLFVGVLGDQDGTIGLLLLGVIAGFVGCAVFSVVQLTRAVRRLRDLRSEGAHGWRAGDLGMAIVVVGGLGLYSLAALVRPEWAGDPSSCTPRVRVESPSPPPVRDLVWPPVSLPEVSSLEGVAAAYGLGRVPQFDGGHPRTLTLTQNSVTGGVDLVLREGTHLPVGELARRFEGIMSTLQLTARGGSSTTGALGTHATKAFAGEGYTGEMTVRDCPGRRNRVTIVISIPKERVGACQPAAARPVCAEFYAHQPRQQGPGPGASPVTAERVAALADGRLRLAHDTVEVPGTFPQSAAEDLRGDLRRDGWRVTINDPGRLDAPARIEATKTVAGVPVLLHRDFRKDGNRVVTTGSVETRAPIPSP